MRSFVPANIDKRIEFNYTICSSSARRGARRPGKRKQARAPTGVHTGHQSNLVMCVCVCAVPRFYHVSHLVVVRAQAHTSRRCSNGLAASAFQSITHNN